MRVSWPATALALPIVAAFVLLLAVVVSERTSAGWFARPAPRLNLAEAARRPKAAIMLRLLREGADPNGRYVVDRGCLDNQTPEPLTPLEAAVMSRELTIVLLLEANGARRDAALSARLVRLAEICKAADIVKYLRN